MKNGVLKSFILLLIILLTIINYASALNTRVEWNIDRCNTGSCSLQRVFIEKDGIEYNLISWSSGDIINEHGISEFVGVDLTGGLVKTYSAGCGVIGTGCYRGSDCSGGCIGGASGPTTDNTFSINKNQVYTWVLEDRYCSSCTSMGRGDYRVRVSMETYNPCTPLTCLSYSAQCGAPTDGCGTNLNCGTCTATNAIGTCDASYQCNYSCNSGFTNCDGSWANGCEYNTANFLTDENNCGACSNVCDSGKLCIDGTCGGDNYWADLNGNLITNADLNDYVKVVSYDSPPFDITEDLDPIITINSNAWKANRSTTLGYNVTSDNYGVNATSLLYVSTTDQDDPMIIEVLNPSCGSYYNKGQTIQVRINASDADDLINGSVKIKGINIKNFTNLESNIINFSYTFSTAGNIQILVEASNTRGKKFKTISNVMVVDNSPSGDEIQYYVASCIDEPKNYEVFNKALIYFNASSTQGLKYTKSTNNYTIISPLLLLFNWTFYSGQTQKYLTPCSGLGSESCPYDTSGTVIHFYRTFPTINDNYAFLSVSIPNNLMV